MAISVLPANSTKKLFGVFNISGELIEVFFTSSEDRVWIYFLGWPSAEEILHAKQQGTHVKQLKVFWAS